MKKGFYIRKSKDGSFVLNVNRDDFKAFLDTLQTNEGWVRFRIYERNEVDEKGFTHNMEVILNLNKQEGNHGEQ
jgi:hypothetical protein